MTRKIIGAPSRHRFYHMWYNMVSRCNSKKGKYYKDYGGRGIRVCERWMDFSNFDEDMYVSFVEFGYDLGFFGEIPLRAISIDRIDNNGNYTPENCRWTTPLVQAKNRRTRKKKLYTVGNKSLSLEEWSNETGIKIHTLAFRMHKMKWSLEKTMTTPLKY